MTRVVVVFSILFGIHLFGGCSSSQEVTTLSAEERFERAKTLFDNEDYLEAINEFTVLTLQFQGSAYADDAQYYLGECRFARGEFLLGVFEYQQLMRNMPASPLVPDTQFKLGLSYTMLSPKSTLDQSYTLKAIDELQTFVEYYPSHPQATRAEEIIRDLTNKLAKKSFEIAEQYSKLEWYKSSIFYYDDVIEKYHDTEYAPLSYLGKVEVLVTREKYKEAAQELRMFYDKYPNSVLRSRADKLKSRIEGELKTEIPVSGSNSAAVESPGMSGR